MKHNRILGLLALVAILTSCALPLGTNSPNSNLKTPGYSGFNHPIEQAPDPGSYAVAKGPTVPRAMQRAFEMMPTAAGRQLQYLESRQTPSTEELENALPLRPDYQEHKSTYDGMIAWAKSHPKAMAYLRSLGPISVPQTEGEMYALLDKLQKEMPQERTTQEEADLARTVSDFKKFAAAHPRKVNDSSRSIQSTWTINPGVPSGGSGDPALDFYRYNMSIACEPYQKIPKITQTADDCSIASIAYCFGSWFDMGLNEPYAQSFYTSFKASCWDTWGGYTWPIGKQFGVMPDDVVGWMHQIGWPFPYAHHSAFNSMPTLLGQVQAWNNPIVTIGMGAWVTDGAHYCVVVGYDSNNVLLNSSWPGWPKTMHMSATEFASAWQMTPTRNAMYAFAISVGMVYPPFGFFVWEQADELYQSIIFPYW